MEAATNNASTATLMEQVLYEVKRVVVGQDRFLERVMVAMLAQGHLLVEGVPGLAKTLTVKTLARTIQGSFKRIQFTPDLVPADLVGTRMYNQKTGEFSTTLGPVFTHLLLADEINRAPAKVQSALLEVMQERQVTIAGETHKVPAPFLVMATQNPIETEGTYALPEAQVDRFMMKVLLGYPTEEEEFVIAQRALAAPVQVLPVATTAQLSALQAECRSVYVDPSLLQYAVKLVAATRAPAQHGVQDIAQFIACGASPRALGIDPNAHDIRFVEDDWESPTLGAWGLGWEVWLDGMEVTQFTYFQEVGSLPCKPVLGEITYGLERLAMYLQGVENVYDLVWSVGPDGTPVTYGNVYHQNEVEQSTYNFEHANVDWLFSLFTEYEGEAKRLLSVPLVLPAYEMVMKCSHTFNLLDARGAISVTERAAYIGRVRALAREVAQGYYNSREALGFPMLKKEAA